MSAFSAWTFTAAGIVVLLYSATGGGWISAMMAKQFIVFNSMSAAPRYFSVKDGKEARKAAMLGAILWLTRTLVVD